MNGKKIIILFLLLGIIATDSFSERLRIGVTLQPYYSWVSNIVKDKADVVGIREGNANSHNYQPRPEDIKRAMDVNVMVVNGVGHDEFIFGIMKAAGIEGKIPVIYANKDVALVPVAGGNGKQVNPHTFVSISASIRQIYTIAEELGKIDKVNADFYRQNAMAYAKKLRKLKAGYMKKLSGAKLLDLRCATIHGGYDYLLHEFGLQVVAVVEPAHGISPTANQLKDTIDKIKQLNVNVVFTEMNFAPKYVSMIQKETGVKVRVLSHLCSGDYTPDNFEKGISYDMDSVVKALLGE